MWPRFAGNQNMHARFCQKDNFSNVYWYLPPANVVCEGYVFTGVCHSFCSQGGGVACVVLFGGACMVSFGGGVRGFIQGGMHGFIWGGMRGFIWGVCMVLFGGCAWFYSGGMHGFIWGACMVLFGGACMVLFGGCAWFFQFFRIQWDTVNERAVRILLECILVSFAFTFWYLYNI